MHCARNSAHSQTIIQRSTIPSTPMMTSRSNGLDTLRTCAIVLVFMNHYMAFVSVEPTFGWFSSAGQMGVDLFFVLSGYLIGNQLFAGIAHQGKISISLTAFYARRALRTWPVFWVVLAAYFIFPTAMGGREPPALWRFLTFTQNYQLQPGTAFSHAWSLCIEEQFYLVLPLLALLAVRVGSRKSQAWTLLASLVCIGIGARIVLWLQYGGEDAGNINSYYPNIYYATLCRFDEFLPGIAIALLKNFHPALWQPIQTRGRQTLAIGLIAVAAMTYGTNVYFYQDGYGYGFLMTAFGYSLSATAFALLVMSALSQTSPLHYVRIPGAYTIALWSYSIYLSHKAIFYIIGKQAKAISLDPSLRLLAITVCTLLVGASLYYLIEAPFMRIRDRRFPHLFSASRRSIDAQVAR